MQEFKGIEDYPIIHEWTISDKQLENAELKQPFYLR
jgi:hypothetical protein